MGRKESQRKPVPSLFTGVPRFEQTGLDLKAQFDKFEANLVATVPVPDPVPSESAAGLQQVVEQKVTLDLGEKQLNKSELKLLYLRKSYFSSGQWKQSTLTPLSQCTFRTLHTTAGAFGTGLVQVIPLLSQDLFGKTW